MGAIERMTISMPAELAETLRQTVAGGEYASASEVVREALRDWTRNRDTERRELEALRAAIKAGLDSGPGIPADQVFAELRARSAVKSRSVPRLVILPAARADPPGAGLLYRVLVVSGRARGQDASDCGTPGKLPCA